MITDAVAGIFQGVVKPILDKWVPDAKDRLEAEQMFFVQAQQINLAQLEVNKTEAASASLFVAGWRPFLGWVCGGGFAYAVVGRDVLNWILAVVVLYTDKPFPTLPNPDVSLMFEVLVGMLGLGGYRTYEKLKGVAR